MTAEEAKSLLSAYREDLPPTERATVAEALELLREDAHLQSWWEDEQAFDRQFASALEAVPVPPDLRDQILAAARQKPENEATQRDDRLLPARQVPRKRLFYAAAAVLLISGGLWQTSFWPFSDIPVSTDQLQTQRDHRLEAFRDAMARFAQDSIALSHRSEDVTEVRSWLARQTGAEIASLPHQITRHGSLGCQTLTWDNEKVSLICFKTEEAKVIHLFIIDDAAFPKSSKPDDLGKICVRQHLETGGWRANGKIFLLVGSNADVRIGGLLNDIREV